MTNILRAKCIVAGDSNVGKTAIVEMFVSNGTKFPKNYLMTGGVHLTQKTIIIPDTDDIVELYLFDSSGKDVYTDFLLKIWKDPCVFCIVYDVTVESSFMNCERWFRLIKSLVSNNNFSGIILANKTDLHERRVVSPRSGQEVAKTLGFQYFECSAKGNVGVEEPFFYLANEWHMLHSEKKQNEGMF